MNIEHINLSPCYYLTIADYGKTILYDAIDTSSITKDTPSVFSGVYALPVKSGETLSLSTLNGTFYYNSMEVTGTLSWSEPATIVQSSGYYSWTFTPADTIHYNTVTGKTFVAINNKP